MALAAVDRQLANSCRSGTFRAAREQSSAKRKSRSRASRPLVLALNRLRSKNRTSHLWRTVMPVSVAESAENSMVANIKRVGASIQPFLTLLESGNGEEYGPQALTIDPIEGLGQVHKENALVLSLLAALFLDLSYGEYHVDCPSVSSEGTLTLRHNIIQEVVCDTVQYDTRQDLSWNTQQRDASVVVTGCSVIFVLVQEVDDVGVLDIRLPCKQGSIRRWDRSHEIGRGTIYSLQAIEEPLKVVLV